MRLMRRPLGPLASWVFTFFGLLLVASTAYAQTSGLAGGAGLTQMFQGLTPDEQQAIMNQLGSGGALGPGTSALTFGQSLGSLNQSRLQQLQQELSVREKRAQEQQRPLIPQLQGGDWVIIEIGFHLPPRASTQP